MEIRQIANAPLSTNARTFGAYKLAQEWKPFTTEIQNIAAKKCVSNMDGYFYRQLAQDFQTLNEGRINILEILSKAASRIVNNKENLNTKAINKYDEFVDNITKVVDNPANVDVIVSKPYWGKARLEKVEGEIYPANVTDSFVDLTIPNTGFKCSLKLGTERRFFGITETPDDDFYFAREKWNDFNNDNITPFGQMFADFNEALIKGFEDLYEGLVKKNTAKGSGKIAPNMNDKSLNSNFIYFY